MGIWLGFFQTPPHNMTVDGPVIMLTSTWIAAIMLFGLGGMLMIALAATCIYFCIKRTGPANEHVAQGVYVHPGLHASSESVELRTLGSRNTTFQTFHPMISTSARAIGSSGPPLGLRMLIWTTRARLAHQKAI